MINSRHGTSKFGCFGKSWNNVHSSSHSLSSSSSSSTFHSSVTATDHKVLHRVLQSCRGSMDLKTATKTHSRVVVLGLATYPSLVSSLISTYARCHQPQIGLRVFSKVLDLFSRNLVIDCLMKGGQCDVAKKVFGKMPVRDVVTWNTMLGGYVKNSRFLDALNLFRRMLSSKVEPDGFTFASVVTACARLGALCNAEWCL
ncbi:structure-specific endonuclease subunit SLX1 [Vigna unguiculata]|uniref:Structure-specific endonuclease subunit SLX1 n=1 Tax=Vigna unguiculata TaxID=3917 RepID=A0A4D6NIY8_VIGUN|nr:structure-specific endonuclease subunit SLX1 [Vigna unguiculata]